MSTNEAGRPSSTTPARVAARAALLLVFFAAGMSWLAPYLASLIGIEMPEWVVTRFYLYTGLPAAILGAFRYARQGGFARTAPVIACALLLLVSLAWTDESELGRGWLKFAGFAVTLPIAALVISERFRGPCVGAFLTSAVLSLGVALVNAPITSTLRFGTLLDASGTWVSNPNSVSGQAAFAAVLLLIPFFERRPGARSRLLRFGALIPLALCLYCVLLSASRTSFLVLAGTFLWMAAVRYRRTPEALVSGCLIGLCLILMLAGYDVLLAETPGAFYEQLNGRLMADDEGNVATLGRRTLIWQYAWNSVASADRWAFGVGAGGVDKTLGSFYELGLFAVGRDGIRRLHSHSTYVEWLLMLGWVGALAPACLGLSAAWRSWRMDRREDAVRRSSLVMFAFLYSFGGVINTDIFWIAYGSLLWAELSLGGMSTTCPPDARPRVAGTCPG